MLGHCVCNIKAQEATRSKKLVELVHDAGHYISYGQVRYINTTIAQRNLDEYKKQANVPVPRNLVPSAFLQFAADNIDVIEETLDG